MVATVSQWFNEFQQSAALRRRRRSKLCHRPDAADEQGVNSPRNRLFSHAPLRDQHSLQTQPSRLRLKAAL